jgi:hypothetical protein
MTESSSHSSSFRRVFDSPAVEEMTDLHQTVEALADKSDINKTDNAHDTPDIRGDDMNYAAVFFAGAFLCNCIPHLACGLQGAPFPSPFAKPRGIGESSPLVNFLWGALNFLVGIYLLSRHPVAVGPNPSFIALIAGALAIGASLSLHFGKVRQDHFLRR